MGIEPVAERTVSITLSIAYTPMLSELAGFRSR